MEDIKGNKIVRVLDIYTKLINECVINKLQEVDWYGVSERTIQRDIAGSPLPMCNMDYASILSVKLVNHINNYSE